MKDRLVICSKSTWNPAIRREHALAREAAGDGHPVVFLERPADIRSMLAAGGRSAWLSVLAHPVRSFSPQPGIEVRPGATIVPPHRGYLPQLVDTELLARRLSRISGIARSTVIATLPWHWPAVARCPAARRVYDCADDWEALVPGREANVRELLSRVTTEADALIVASAALRELFNGRDAPVVRNGTGMEVVLPPVSAPPGERRMVYLGTLSDRFDADLTAGILDTLPAGWSMELYGPFQYPRSGAAPAEEMERLLTSGRRVRWHGVIERGRVAEVLDRADVLVLPHRRFKPGTASPTPSWRGDTMKFYDYAARARPIVSTTWADELNEIGPPGLHLADDPAGFAAAVLGAANEGAGTLARQRAWAEEQVWKRRWEEWKRFALEGRSSSAVIQNSPATNDVADRLGAAARAQQMR